MTELLPLFSVVADFAVATAAVAVVFIMWHIDRRILKLQAALATLSAQIAAMEKHNDIRDSRLDNHARLITALTADTAGIKGSLGGLGK